jgi:hypothetical protein
LPTYTPTQHPPAHTHSLRSLDLSLLHSGSLSPGPACPLQFLEGLLIEAYPVVKKAVGGISSLAGRLNLRVSGGAPTRAAHARARC